MHRLLRTANRSHRPGFFHFFAAQPRTAEEAASSLRWGTPIHFATWGLRWRLMATVGIAVVPALVLILLAAAQRFHTARAQGEQVAQTQARLAAGDYQRYLDSSHQLLMALQALREVVAQDATGCNTLVSQLHREYPLYANIFAARADGSVFCSAVPAALQSNVSGSPWFRQALTNRTFEIRRDDKVAGAAGEPLVVLAHPILGSTGATEGVIGVSLDPAWLEKFAAAPLPAGWTETVLDAHGEPLVTYPANAGSDLLPPLGSPAFMTLLLGPAEGIFEGAARSGRQRLYGFARAFSPMENQQLTVLVSAPQELAFSAEENELQSDLMWLALAALLSAAAAWIASELFVLRQVRGLRAAVHHLTVGNLNARVELAHSAPELQEVANAFNRMALTIQQREAELCQARNELEARVVERTARLDQANVKLLAEVAERRHKEEVLQQTQAQLIQAEKMSALGRLAAALAHEINNPLQAIRTHLELLTIGVPLDDQTRDRYATIAHSEVERLGRLVERTLHFARPAQAPRSPVAVNTLVEQALALTEKRRQQAEVELISDLQPTPLVVAAADQLIQVLINLILNAVESTDKTGSTIWVSTAAEGGHVLIRVADDGALIAPEHLPHIFEPFFTTKATGTGLGLSVSHSLIQEHGGSLSVATSAGASAGAYTVEFTVSLPAYAPAAAPSELISHEWVHSP